VVMSENLSGCLQAAAVFFAFVLVLLVTMETFAEKTNNQVETIRFATFNAALNRANEGELITDLSTPDNAQAKVIAEIIQHVNPDVLLISEFDFDEDGRAANLFKQNYLAVNQNGAGPADYPYVYIAPSNTGVPSGKDLDNSGSIGGPNDAFGYGSFPGQFGMVIYAKYPIMKHETRTFQTFLWKDMPDALLPGNPATSEPMDWYSADVLEIFRLSSKSHWDVPVAIGNAVVHVLASHPTPPVFDGAENRNGTRNHDEIRFWADYIKPGKRGYMYDDDGIDGGLQEDKYFVIMGDLNADPLDGDSTNNPVRLLLNHPLVNTEITPASEGGIEAANKNGRANESHLGDPRFDTADFADSAPGNLRTDYVLPSKQLKIKNAGVFWPVSSDPLSSLIGTFTSPGSDHRLVWVDVNVPQVHKK
jgi:Endonuclease/Exonuclease/phosphatase family